MADSVLFLMFGPRLFEGGVERRLAEQSLPHRITLDSTTGHSPVIAGLQRKTLEASAFQCPGQLGFGFVEYRRFVHIDQAAPAHQNPSVGDHGMHVRSIREVC
jgi:hypothetical protein